MPLPTPKKGEKQQDFVSRCMGDSTMNKEYPDQKQRAAVCHSQWDKAQGNAALSEAEFREVPIAAMRFREEGLSLAAAEGDEKQRRFKMRLYSGSVMEHAWFGRVAIDLSTVKHKQKIPALFEHATREIFGYADRIDIEHEVDVAGPILKNNAAADEITSLLEQGVPLEASARYSKPDHIDYLDTGASMNVNGRTIEGPVEIWRGCRLMEASACALGVDSETETSLAASEGGRTVRIPKPVSLEDSDMADTTMTAAAVEEQYPDAAKDLKASAAEKATTTAQDAERKRFADLQAAFPDRPAFVGEQFLGGSDVAQAKVAAADLLAAENKDLQAKLTAAEEKVRESAKAAGFSASDGETPPKDGEGAEQPKDFMAAVEAHAKSAKCLRGDAIKACVKAYPKLYNAYREAKGI